MSVTSRVAVLGLLFSFRGCLCSRAPNPTGADPIAVGRTTLLFCELSALGVIGLVLVE